jgi:hypothetical protein
METHAPGVRLSLDLDDPAAVPYFLWDEPITLAVLRARLRTASRPERIRLLGRILREARDPDVWRFTTPDEVAASWPDLQRYLGRRRTFWEFLLQRWQELKPTHGVVRVDPAEEIFANKLCTLLGRSEIRDLVDVRALEGLGLSLTEALAAAQRKDGGLTPAQLAWVLSQITIGDEATLPGEVAPSDLRDYRRGLVDRLVRLARP